MAGAPGGRAPSGVDAGAPLPERGDQVVAVLAASLADRPVLCDLTSAQAAVLERNVSPAVAAQYKRTAIVNVGALAALTRTRVPELTEGTRRGSRPSAS